MARFLTIVLGFTLISFQALAQQTMIEGRLLDATGTSPIEEVDVDFTIQVYYDAGQSCLMYSEQYQNVDMSNSSGYFNFELGSGSSPVYYHGASQLDLFDNNVVSNCQAGGPMAATAGAARYLKISFNANDGNPLQNLANLIKVGATPFAMYAEYVGDNSISDLNLMGAGAGGPAQILTSDGSNGFTWVTANLANAANWDAAFSWGDHGAAGYLLPAAIANSANWDTAFSWGDHGAAGYLLPAAIANSANWDAAFSWGDHGAAGYLLPAAIANSANWDTAFSWGDHGAAGYLLPAAIANSANWDAAFSWGDHGAAGYLLPAGASMTGAITMNSETEVRFGDSVGGEYAAFKAPNDLAANYILTLPMDDGLANQVLETDGSGVLSWVNAPAPGANTVTSAMIINGELVDADINASAAIAASKISAPNWDTAFSWGDHGAAGYLLPAAIANSANWDAAFSWGDHGAAGYLLPAAIANSANWDAAFSWGDHGAAGYLLPAAIANSANWDTAFSWGDHGAAGYLLPAAIANSANWDAAFSWGDHGAAGYLLPAAIANSANWDAAFSWGDHGAAGYLLQGGNTLGADVSLGTTDAFGINFRTGGSDKMRIENNGQVGINQAVPSETLVVRQITAEDIFSVRNNGGAPQLMVDTVGNLGVKTATPLADFHVYGRAFIDDGGAFVDGNGCSPGDAGQLINSGAPGKPLMQCDGSEWKEISDDDDDLPVSHPPATAIIDVLANDFPDINISAGDCQSAAGNYDFHNIPDGEEFRALIYTLNAGPCILAFFSDAGSTALNLEGDIFPHKDMEARLYNFKRIGNIVFVQTGGFDDMGMPYTHGYGTTDIDTYANGKNIFIDYMTSTQGCSSNVYNLNYVGDGEEVIVRVLADDIGVCNLVPHMGYISSDYSLTGPGFPVQRKGEEIEYRIRTQGGSYFVDYQRINMPFEPSEDMGVTTTIDFSVQSRETKLIALDIDCQPITLDKVVDGQEFSILVRNTTAGGTASCTFSATDITGGAISTSFPNPGATYANNAKVMYKVKVINAYGVLTAFVETVPF